MGFRWIYQRVFHTFKYVVDLWVVPGRRALNLYPTSMALDHTILGEHGRYHGNSWDIDWIYHL